MRRRVWRSWRRARARRRTSRSCSSGSCRATTATGTGTARSGTVATTSCRSWCLPRSRSRWTEAGRCSARGSGWSSSTPTGKTTNGFCVSRSCRPDSDEPPSPVLQVHPRLTLLAVRRCGYRLDVALPEQQAVTAIELDLEPGLGQVQDRVARLRRAYVGPDPEHLAPHATPGG